MSFCCSDTVGALDEAREWEEGRAAKTRRIRLPSLNGAKPRSAQTFYFLVFCPLPQAYTRNVQPSGLRPLFSTICFNREPWLRERGRSLIKRGRSRR